MSRRQGLIFGAQIGLLAAAVTTAVLTSEAADWQPVALVALLFALAVGSDIIAVGVRSMRVSGAFVAIVLAMTLLGPAPALAIGAVSAVIDAILSRRRWDKAFNNVVTWGTFPLAGGLLAEALLRAQVPMASEALTFAAVVLGVFMATNTLNFLMVAAFQKATYGASIVASVRNVFVTLLPTQFAAGLLTACVAFSYERLGVGAVGLAAVVLFVFQYLLRAGVNAHERGEELAQRTHQLASLQVGLLSTVLQTLSMRDAMTARHSTAVARYTREVARMLGVGDREQELIHTAALLHDIGKFIFPDSILFADRKLTDDEWATVKLHPCLLYTSPSPRDRS